jgi:hypothetical protein
MLLDIIYNRDISDKLPTLRIRGKHGIKTDSLLLAKSLQTYSNGKQDKVCNINKLYKASESVVQGKVVDVPMLKNYGQFGERLIPTDKNTVQFAHTETISNTVCVKHNVQTYCKGIDIPNFEHVIQQLPDIGDIVKQLLSTILYIKGYHANDTLHNRVIEANKLKGTIYINSEGIERKHKGHLNLHSGTIVQTIYNNKIVRIYIPIISIVKSTCNVVKFNKIVATKDVNCFVENYDYRFTDTCLANVYKAVNQAVMVSNEGRMD